MNEDEKTQALPVEETQTEGYQFIGVDDLTEEEKQQIINQVNDFFSEVYSIEGAILKATDEAYLRKESFRQVGKRLRKTHNEINSRIIQSEIKIFETYQLKLLSFLLNSGRGPLLDQIINKISETEQQLKQLSHLLRDIRKSFRILKRYNAESCNLEINELVTLIHGKAVYVVRDSNDYIEKCKMASRGISFIASNKNQEQIQAIDENIDAYVQVLGLYKTPGDK